MANSEWAEAEASRLVANWWHVWDCDGCINQIALALDQAVRRGIELSSGLSSDPTAKGTEQ